MRHDAIYKAYPNAVTIDDSAGVFDKNGNKIVIDLDLINKTIIDLDAQKAQAETEAAAAKATLLAKLGITEEEAKLLLS
jgi:hypothetical protein